MWLHTWVIRSPCHDEAGKGVVGNLMGAGQPEMAKRGGAIGVLIGLTPSQVPGMRCPVMSRSWYGFACRVLRRTCPNQPSPSLLAWRGHTRGGMKAPEDATRSTSAAVFRSGTEHCASQGLPWACSGLSETRGSPMLLRTLRLRRVGSLAS